MATIKSVMGGLVLATIFQIYFDQMARGRVSGSMMPKLIALAVVFLVSNLVHWLVFRETSRSFQRKFTFSLQLWLFFFGFVALNGVLFHRGLAKEIDPTLLAVTLFVLKNVAKFGVPLSLLNCLVARWSEPSTNAVPESLAEPAD
jgi:hypothetical protein